MKKTLLTLMCLAVMMVAGIGLKAQEITITLLPGWTWISYPQAVPMELTEAMGDFVPAEGDIIKSQSSYVIYWNGSWLGDVMYFMPGRGYKYYSSRSEAVSFVFAQPSSSVVATATPTDITATSAVAGGMVMLPEGSHVFLRGVCWGTTPSPNIDGNRTTNGTGIGTFTTTLDGLNPNTTYYVRAYAVSDYGLAYGNQQSFTTVVEYQYVDLGLPSGLLWATCNLGADAPENYGDYFAWGETQPKDNFSWTNYQYCMGSFNTLTKYCNNPDIGYNGFTDDLTTLLPEDDAATANWGDDWRMPTEGEWQELYQNTTVTWITQNGVNGRLFTASNGNSLFLPSAGYCNESVPEAAGIIGDYWTSSLDTDYPSGALSFFFNSSNYYISFCNRLYGRNVRAVRSGSQSTSFIIDATANPVEGGVVSGAGSYQVGAECTLTATANEGYTFSNWTENDEVVSTDATYTFTVNADRTLVANFTYNGGVVVTTSEPMDITTNSATCGGNVASSSGDYVFVILRGICWGTNPNPTFNDNYIEAGNGLGSFTVSMTGLIPNTTFYARAFAVTSTGTFYGGEMSFTTDHEYVDLGLPSGLLWATCNVGADNPEDYGDYFAWGEIQPKDYYDWSTYKYCNNGDDHQLTKYCNNSSHGYNGFTDYITALLPEDDAATSNWGSAWRMPSAADWIELYQNTTYTWTTQNGVNGRCFVASNGNSLFLPAAGSCYESSLYLVGSIGRYWSSQLYTQYPSSALYYCFISDPNYNYVWGDGSRCSGRSVRPVRSASQN